MCPTEKSMGRPNQKDGTKHYNKNWKIPWPGFSRCYPALTSINRRKSAIKPELASINVCYRPIFCDFPSVFCGNPHSPPFKLAPTPWSFGFSSKRGPLRGTSQSCCHYSCCLLVRNSPPNPVFQADLHSVPHGGASFLAGKMWGMKWWWMDSADFRP